MGETYSKCPWSVELQPIPEFLELDRQDAMAKSYKLTQKEAQKIFYNWHSIPIISVIDFANPKCLKVKNKGIHDNNFVVGIIKKTALQSTVSTPWKKGDVICYESHQKEGESGIVYQDKFIKKCGRGLKENEELTMIIRNSKIEFKIGGQVLGLADIPTDLLQTQILPYVTLFHVGDKIQFWAESPN